MGGSFVAVVGGVNVCGISMTSTKVERVSGNCWIHLASSLRSMHIRDRVILVVLVIGLGVRSIIVIVIVIVSALTWENELFCLKVHSGCHLWMLL